MTSDALSGSEEHDTDVERRVMIKTESWPALYQREVCAYEFDCVRNSPYIRSMVETINNGMDKCMVFE